MRFDNGVFESQLEEFHSATMQNKEDLKKLLEQVG